ncbi:glycoside hydrolase [Sulfuricaulis limicola]|uniref:Glycoside hydrolase n=1 Tax=Sulfuricaulis limicola TaxID=1620215 RepID=A0A1B4XF44_9GAMM|nr:glycoside hydrolase family 57 protein [Sulfuricaulis limicola]BAV33420.1 glycoside hydrolase [Sulfuricaulis limicola]
MPDDIRLKVVLCWHMHQPQYRDLMSGSYHLPWTYLHAIKDYTDMAAHLEAVPAARAVVNFAPLLLEQIEDYAKQVEGFLTNSLAIRDPLLAALISPAQPPSDEERIMLIKACVRANEARMIGRFPAFHRLAEMAAWCMAHPESLRYLSNQYLADLLVWYHLAWLGETVRRNDARIKRLLEKETGYSLHDRRELLSVIGELLSNVIPRYRQLAARGQVELSVTPYAHPIVPLLLDFACAREAMPQAPLPLLPQYPGGEERARWHIREGIETFRRHFGFAPAGCWPSEGAVSTPSLKLLAQAGFRWAASGEGVLHNSLAQSGHAEHGMKEAWLYRHYSVADSGMSCFFRDDGLSDLIGFTYAGWHADDAVNNLVHHLENIAHACRAHPEHVVSIIMDGENAWEHYPENAYFFLSALYRRLSEHPGIELTTFSDCLKTVAAKHLPQLTAGSWVYGTLSTWIGEPDKNRGWDMLGDAKHAFDAAASRLSAEQLERARRQLAICEGSDWFWWFGGDNPASTVADFEQLYRQHLTNLYQLIGTEPPEYLAQVFTRGGGAPRHGGVMRPGQLSTG